MGRSVRRPCLAHENLVGFDRERAAPFGHLEQVDQIWVEVQLLARLAQAGRQSEEELLAAVRQSKVVSKRELMRLRVQAGHSLPMRSMPGTLGAFRCTST